MIIQEYIKQFMHTIVGLGYVEIYLLTLYLCTLYMQYINIPNHLPFNYSSATDNKTKTKVAIKKLARPFQSHVHAKRTYRELRMLRHMDHENVINYLIKKVPLQF